MKVKTRVGDLATNRDDGWEEEKYPVDKRPVFDLDSAVPNRGRLGKHHERSQVLDSEQINIGYDV